ncbi:hypothetical protein SNARM312S_04035 [Streptomyces narbonensis]
MCHGCTGVHGGAREEQGRCGGARGNEPHRTGLSRASRVRRNLSAYGLFACGPSAYGLFAYGPSAHRPFCAPTFPRTDLFAHGPTGRRPGRGAGAERRCTSRDTSRWKACQRAPPRAACPPAPPPSAGRRLDAARQAATPPAGPPRRPDGRRRTTRRAIDGPVVRQSSATDLDGRVAVDLSASPARDHRDRASTRPPRPARPSPRPAARPAARVAAAAPASSKSPVGSVPCRARRPLPTPARCGVLAHGAVAVALAAARGSDGPVEEASRGGLSGALLAVGSHLTGDAVSPALARQVQLGVASSIVQTAACGRRRRSRPGAQEWRRSAPRAFARPVDPAARERAGNTSSTTTPSRSHGSRRRSPAGPDGVGAARRGSPSAHVSTAAR